jgi:hypothetical protein
MKIAVFSKTKITNEKHCIALHFCKSLSLIEERDLVLIEDHHILGSAFAFSLL